MPNPGTPAVAAAGSVPGECAASVPMSIDPVLPGALSAEIFRPTGAPKMPLGTGMIPSAINALPQSDTNGEIAETQPYTFSFT